MKLTQGEQRKFGGLNIDPTFSALFVYVPCLLPLCSAMWISLADGMPVDGMPQRLAVHMCSSVKACVSAVALRITCII